LESLLRLKTGEEKRRATRKNVAAP
jgi:hypothetical protein